MINYTPADQRSFSLFCSPFEGQLDANNRWVRMAALVPWDDMAKVFSSSMSKDQGRASVDLRIVVGALLVKHIEGISDEDTIQYIQENIYAQYFVGLASFQTKPVFSPTLFVEIRKRLGLAGAQQLNDLLLQQAHRLRVIKHRAKPKKKDSGGQDDQGPTNMGQGAKESSSLTDQAPPVQSDDDPIKNKGKLMLDATVAPQHIGYPTDTRLLHEARLDSEDLIDKLYLGSSLWSNKPRTYRRVAQQQYMDFIKKRKPGKKEIKRTRGKQLNYLKRNLGHINRMLDDLEQAGHAATLWKRRDWQRFWVLNELYRQQRIMHQDNRKRIDDRIVNIAQPYVRPIKRGKAGKDTEFGAKLNMSLTEGFARMDQISFNSFNEGILLQEQVQTYKAMYGYYPEVVLVDRIYLNRENRKFLTDNAIRHVGKILGRPKQMTKQEKHKRRKEQNQRSEVEGKFGQGKSKYGLDDIQTRRIDTSFACIGLILLALNLIKLGKAILLSIFNYCYGLFKRLVGCQIKIGITIGLTNRVNQWQPRKKHLVAIKLG